ncbi:nitroreductase family protein [Roseisolibacter sp. H3M3-2]|uniref:nitroreductase family protein n=1 Tax=Roseisolibacter sp. H3M3-2 TaxID=3031323 RepID=UPI0023DC442C|nr:nitroreductase family protein [Roseisolibacter sp. H3M3-2]MDF1501713.1 nitroreductase family protein [Roseisolibacter sp. H3M3-2]
MSYETTALLDVKEAAARRRSIRDFAPDAIPEGDLDAILDVVRLAPSAFNVQPWRFVVVRDPGLKAGLAEAAFNQRQVRSAPAVLVLYTDMRDALATVEETVHPGMPAEKAAAAAAHVRNLFGRQSPEQQETWAAGQGYIALGYLLLAAEAHGYQTSPMTGFEPARVRTLLGLPEHVQIPALVAIGRGAEEGFAHHRHPLGRIVRAA